jgi:hypothetical protein
MSHPAAIVCAMSNTTLRISISCDTCVMRATAACDDCLVTHLCGADESDHVAATRASNPRSSEAVVLDLDELRAMRLLASAGLVPTLRHREAI